MVSVNNLLKNAFVEHGYVPFKNKFFEKEQINKAYSDSMKKSKRIVRKKDAGVVL